MAALRTEITEIVTGLAMLGADTLEEALRERPAELVHVDDATWQRLLDAHHDGGFATDFLAAWNNGRAFARSPDALRGRRPALVEWKGAHRDPGDVVLPADLRVDHVYLVSCKYLSRVLHNASPAMLFDEHLQAARSRRGDGDWFDVVAPAEHQTLYQTVRRRHAPDLDLPESVGALSSPQRKELRRRIPREWDQQCATAYADLCARAASESARRWDASLRGGRQRRSMLWRLLRLGPAPYFVLGTSPRDTLRLRVDTPWDFVQAFEMGDLVLDAPPAGQAVIGWHAEVRRRADGERCDVAGHVELRWSHGRFGGPPEAKVYLDTPHTQVPGYTVLG